jgi:ABC-2 type transport system ATP-binding protein
MSTIIQAQNLTRRFGALTAVDHLNLEVAEGEIFGLVGPDGAGKTTTMRLLCGLMNSSEGRAIVAGHDVARELDAVKDQIGYMAQRFGLYNDLSVEENMIFYSDLFGMTGRERDELSVRLLRMTRMEPFRSRPAGKLSGGMKQKLALMCTLLHKPRVLFLDEPTNGVDPVSRRDFWAILYQLVRDGLTVFVTTAYLDEAERAHRVGFMYQGRMIRCDTPAALKRGLEHAVYLVTSKDPRKTREVLERQPGVLTLQPSGADLHLFLDPNVTSPEKLAELTPFGHHPIAPSLEDVFISLVGHNTAPLADARGSVSVLENRDRQGAEAS